MLYNDLYIVPDYYGRFACKGPDCRSTCCRGWNISFSMTEYYRLLGLQCSKSTRRALDTGLTLARSPSRDRYAVMNPRWDGDCPLHRGDGFCALQKECGEGVLTAVCRYYPRSPKRDYGHECACSNSCEAVLELLFSQKEPIGFHTAMLSFDLPAPPAHRAAPPDYNQTRTDCIAILQDRSFTLRQRLAKLGGVIAARCDSGKALRGDSADAPDALPVLVNLAIWCARDAATLAPFCDKICALLNIKRSADGLVVVPDDAKDVYMAASEHFDAVLPDSQIYFEHMLVNHVFYERFPFSDKYEDMWSEYAALCAVYALCRFFGVCTMTDKTSISDFVDVQAALFRLVDHSDFDRSGALMLKREHSLAPQSLSRLIAM